MPVSPPNLPTAIAPSYLPHKHHHLGWGIVIVALVVTALTPRLNEGPWHELGRGISDNKFSPYNIYLTLGIIGLLFVAYAARSRSAALRVVTVMVVETACYGLIKLITWHGFHLFPRPSGKDGGFPSGHTAAVCALAYLLTERWPRLAILWYGFAALVGWARWASGAHYPYQVVGGAILGLTVAVTLSRRFADTASPQAE